MKRQRLSSEIRKKQILDIALKLAEEIGYQNVSQATIAAAAKISPKLTIWHFGTMTQLKRAIMRAAIEREIIPIIAQGIGAQDVHAHKAPDELKQRATEYLIK
jgi:AcrR family transcriptional regulator